MCLGLAVCGSRSNLSGTMSYLSQHLNISRYHPLKCVQWQVLLGGALGRMFGGSSNFLLTFDSKSMYIGYVLTISWLN